MIKMIMNTLSFTAPGLMAAAETAAADKYADVNGSGMFSAERWELSGQMILIGMVMVFAVLALLWGIIVLSGLIFRKKEVTKTQEITQAVEPVDNTGESTEQAGDDTDDGQLTAVITAAIAAVISEDEHLSAQFASGFRVVSFNRSGKNK